MARTKISEFSATPSDNTDIDGIDIAEGCAPSGINNAIRELMAQLKDMQTGASGDTFTFTAADINGGTVDGTTIGASTPSSGVFTSVEGTSGVISANSSGDALRITQVGAGNALLVEDSANPDASPVIIDANGNLVIGATASTIDKFEVWGTGSAFTRNTDNATNFQFYLQKSRGTQSAPTSVQSGDFINSFRFRGYDGVGYIDAASISAAVDGTPGTNDMPGRLIFSTTADGASSPTERMRINNAGNVGIGSASITNYSLRVGSQLAGSTTAYGIALDTTVDSAVTSAAYGYQSRLTTEANAFTLSALNHYFCSQPTLGASSAITDQFGYRVDSSLTGATNNYGFYSAIASGTGRYNFYAAGTADNYFGGNTTISVNSSGDALRITQVGAGNALLVEDSANPDATPFVVDASGNVVVGNTSSLGSGSLQTVGSVTRWSFSADAFASAYSQYKSRSATVGTQTVVQSGDELGNHYFYGSDGTNYLIGARITAAVDGTPGTNDMPGRLVFSTTADGASSPTERLRIRSDGNIGFGGSGDATISFWNQKAITGGTTAYGYALSSTIQSGVTTVANGYYSGLSTQAAAFTLGTMRHYNATQSTIGSTSAVVNQMGFYVDSTLTGATNNYGFYGNIASGTGRWNFYAAGTADNYFAGNVAIGTTTTSIAKLYVSAGNIATDQSVLSRVSSALANGSRGFRGLIDGTEYFALYNDNTNTVLSASGTTRINVINSSGTISLGAAPGSESLRVTPVASAVNYLNVYGAATGNQVNMRVEGSDTNIGFNMTTKGASPYDFYTSTYGAQQFRISHTASAVNYLQVTGASTGNDVTIRFTGSDTNVSGIYAAKGTGSHRFFTNDNNQQQFNIAHTASAVNYLQVTGAAAGGSVAFSAQGSDTDIGISYSTKGGNNHTLRTGGGTQFSATHTASAVNYVAVTGSATGTAVTMFAAGSDTNIDLAITPKGTGVLKFGTYTAGTIVQAGYITVKDAAGNTRRLLVG